MPIAYTLAAATPAGPTALDNPMEILWGFVFVVIVLGILALVTQIIGKVFITVNKAQAAKAPKPASPLATNLAPVTAEDDEIVAVISAAVHTALKQPHRIVSIQSRGRDTWASEGRRQIFSSHKVR